MDSWTPGLNNGDIADITEVDESPFHGPDYNYTYLSTQGR